MREILFRGQTRKLGEKVKMNGEKLPGKWVYGGIFQGTGCYSVMYGCPDANDITGATLEKHVVYTDTVGQFTGLTDKNGTKIFEGDIVKDEYILGKVVYNTKQEDFDGAASFMIDDVDDGLQSYRFWNSVEVIGNIHDNPELIGGADNGL